MELLTESYAGDTLVVAHVRSVVYSAHVFNENVELYFVINSEERHFYLVLASAAFDCSGVFSVHVEHSSVVQAVVAEFKLFARSFYYCRIQRVAEALSDVLLELRSGTVYSLNHLRGSIKNKRLFCELYLAVSRFFAVLDSERGKCAVFVLYNLAYCVECGRHVSGFAEQCVVVVACDGRFKYAVVVRAVHESEVCAAVEHIEVEGSAGVYHVAEKSGKLVGFACVVTVVPVVEPSAPVFTAHMGLIRTEFFEHCEVFNGM